MGKPAARPTGGLDRPGGSGGSARPLAGLFALVLAGGLCLATTGSAQASFESAVTAYEQGAYVAAQREFQSLADTGDDRAEPYLESIRLKLRSKAAAEESVAMALESAVTELFDTPDSPSVEPPAVSPAAAPERSAGGRPAGYVDVGGRFGQTPSAADPDVVVPQHGSFWSTVYHLPGDATVVGLQYVAQFLSADNLERELHALSSHSDEISISVLAGFWWLLIVRGAIGTALAVGRVMKAATTPRKERRYG